MRVSVVMATKNPNPNSLKEVMDSVYGQTYNDFELIIVDDGSERLVSELAAPFVNNSVRTSFYRINPSGLGAALNFGIAHSEGEYIARIDDDDLMLPSRLEKQVSFLDIHPEVSCVGTWFFDRVGNKYYPHRKYPLGHDEIAKDLLSLNWGMAHTSVMYRRKSFDKIGGYRIPGGGQDMDLFLQMGTVGQLANINDYLTCYTLSSGGLGSVNPKKKDAYVFALKEVLEHNQYPEFEEIIRKSIAHLEKDSKRNYTLKTRIIRNLMMMKIKVLGKKYLPPTGGETKPI